MLASIMASLVAVPVASTNITGDYNNAVGMVAGMEGENSSDVPREVTEKIGSDGFSKTIDTGFGKAEFRAEGSKFVSELENPGKTVRMVKKPGEKIYSIRDSEVSLEKKEGTTGVKTVCKTPYGTLETGKELGDTVKSFEGSHRRKVEQRCEEAEEQLEDSVQKLVDISAESGLLDKKRYSKAVEITEIDPEVEYIELRNTGPLTVSLEDWTVSDKADNEHTFEDARIEPGETVKLYSGDAEEDCETYCWTGSIVWNQDGDTAELRDSSGNLVDTRSY